MKVSLSIEPKVTDQAAWIFMCRGTLAEVMHVYLDLKHHYQGLLVAEPSDYERPPENRHHVVKAWTTDRVMAMRLKLCYCG
jgi:hypothetical protein